MDDRHPPPGFVAAMERHGARPCAPSPYRHAAFTALGARFEEGLLYAAHAHRQQSRKGTPVPYLSHLLGVAAIVLTYGGNEDQAIAGLLHDTVEDCGAEHEAVIEARFGPEVLRIVLACTDARVPAGEVKADWWARKRAYLADLRDLPPGDGALLVSCSDKLYNADSILGDLEALGPDVWDRFRGREPEDVLWYYEAVADVFDEMLPGPPATRLRATVDAIGQLHRAPAGPS